MGIFTVQNDFTHGEISETMIGRSDIELYRKAAKKMRNVLVIPQGGATRRFGTEFIARLNAESDKYKLASFAFTEEEQYLLVFSDLQIEIYLNDVLVATIVTPWPADDINDIRFAQTTNLMVLVHEDFQPRQLSRGVDSSTWNFGLVAFSFIPPHDFNRNYNAQSFTLTLVVLGTTTLTVTAGSFVFTDAFVGGIFIAAGATVSEPIGFARITAFISPTSVTVDITIPFRGPAPATFAGTDVTVAEKSWGDLEADLSGDRGWPKTVTFYEGRLWFGGSRSLPQHLFGSQTGDFIDFETGVGLDSEAIIAELSSRTINNIKHLVADRGLQVFTFSSEWTPPQSSNLPLTPSTISIVKQTNRGTTEVEPQVLDNVTFYVKKGGKGVMAYAFTITDESYDSNDISIISNDLIRDPVDSTVFSRAVSEDADFLLLANSDGTLASYQTLRAQNVSAWTLSDTFNRTEEGETPAKFKRLTTVGDDLYFIIERTINDAIVQYIEKASFDLFTDSTICQNFGPPVLVVDGLGTLEGQEVQVIGDGFVQKDKVVLNGQITLDDEATTVCVGIGFKWEIEMLPITVVGQEGPNTFVPKRINRGFIRYFNSLGIRFNGQLVENLQFGDTFTESTLLNTSPPQTGVQTKRLLGWDIDTKVVISGAKPLPATVLTIGYEVTT